MADFLLELRSEEIPARMQAGARVTLEKLFREAMAAAGVALSEASVWSTPRRLALIARELPHATEAVSEELKGPKVGAPRQALEGFLRKTGLAQDQLVERGGVWFAVSEKPGRPTADVLAQAIPTIIRAFSWPKSMRWGAASLSPESLRWVRPLSGIVALLDADIVAFEIDGIQSGRRTMGHRFHSHGEITVETPASYAQQLRAHHVIVDHAAREAIIREGAADVAASAGLVLVEDEGLVIENAGLTEWPVPLLGRFDAAFLEVPPEVIQLTARTNQKYFICQSPPRNGEGNHPQDGGGAQAAHGKLANAFICTANIVAVDGGAAIVAGNRKVLAARLSDARFFWEQDRKHTLAEQAGKLDRITFHEKLGTLADKVERVAKLARWLVEEVIVPPSPLSRAALAAMAEQAARLCKADLVTEMVGEFPELQGLMGGYYARAEGLPDEVADAIRDQYRPLPGEPVPEPPVSVALCLADKLDTLFAFFAIGEFPTGSKDPFALRRAAIAIIRLILHNRLQVGIGSLVAAWVRHNEGPDPAATILDFLHDRLSVQLRELGIRHDFVLASRNWLLATDDRLDRVGARAFALQRFITTEDGANLLAGYKRAANILKKEGFSAPLPLAGGVGGGLVSTQSQQEEGPTPSPSRKREGDYAPEPAEAALIAALHTAAPRAEAAIAAEDFAGAMAALAVLRPPIDAFFEAVTVNDPDAAKRAARLALLDQFRAAVHKVADFSLIEG